MSDVSNSRFVFPGGSFLHRLKTGSTSTSDRKKTPVYSGITSPGPELLGPCTLPVPTSCIGFRALCIGSAMALQELTCLAGFITF